MKLKTRFFKVTEGVGAGIFAALFGTFLLQIISRYLFRSPISWTVELCLTLWVWLIFWGNAFIVCHDEHVAFNVLYHGVGKKTRRVFAFLGALAIVSGFVWSFFPTWDFIAFLKIKKSAGLKIPMNWVFSIYVLFMITSIIAYGRRIYVLIRHGLDEEGKPESDFPLLQTD